MPNPRNIVAYEGIAPVYATYLIDGSTITYDATKAGGSAQVNLAVVLSASKTVALTQDASAVHGKLILVEADGKCTVQTGGYCTLPGGASATLTPGSRVVGALGAANARGYIRSVAAATLAEVAVARGEIVDAATATAVVVKF
jgi:hypothetical protein